MSHITTLSPTPSSLKRFLLVIIGAVLMAVNLKTFVNGAHLFPGGFVGLSLLIQRICSTYAHITIPYSILYLALNSVPVYISFRYIGKKFTLYSLLMIAVSSILADLLPTFSVTNDVLLCSIFGGLLNGLAIVLCLHADATSGGTDFIAIFFSEKYGKDTWTYIFIGNCCVLAAAGLLFGWNSALYSIIFQFTSTQVLNMLYRRYQRSTMLIVTDKPHELYTLIESTTHHDATVWQATGCYSNTGKTLLYTVVSGEEVQSLSKELKKADPTAFINVLHSNEILGKFYMQPND